ncbi:unnamed protein product [Leptosia nina]|uniref:Uncharacterized protein n=1 Tax=Leptosia nina TaxID=320188 RepID=A0AAV1JTS7_9NEOP
MYIELDNNFAQTTSLHDRTSQNSREQITEYRHARYISQFPATAKLRNNIVAGLTFGAESSIVIIGKAGLRAVPVPAGPLRGSHPTRSITMLMLFEAVGWLRQHLARVPTQRPLSERFFGANPKTLRDRDGTMELFSGVVSRITKSPICPLISHVDSTIQLIEKLFQ